MVFWLRDMIIELKEEILDFTGLSKVDIDNYIESLANIVKSIQSGKHMLFANHRTFSRIQATIEIPENIRSKFRTTHSKIQDSNTAIKKTNTFIRLSRLDGKIHTLTLHDKIAIDVPLIFFYNTTICERTVLLCENLVDAKVLLSMTKIWLKRIGLSKAKFSLEKRGAGGSQIGAEYDEIQNDAPRLCIAVVDSDQDSPNHNKTDSTAITLLNHDDPQNPLTKAYVLLCRELENLLNEHILTSIFSAQPEAQKKAKRMFEIRSLASDFVLKHADLKNGCKLKDILKYSADCQKIWLPEVEKIITTQFPIDNQCLAKKTCKDENKCECNIIGGFGKRTLQKSQDDFFSKPISEEYGEFLPEYVIKDWENVCIEIFSWGCSSEPFSVY